MKKEYGNQVYLLINESLMDGSLSVTINYSTSGSKTPCEMEKFVNHCNNALGDAQVIESMISEEKTLDDIKKEIGLL